MAFRRVNLLKPLALGVMALWLIQDAGAATITTQCRYINNNRSIVVVKASGLRGSYYARVYSYNLKEWIASRPKVANANGTVRFDFDSVARPGTTLIPANFNNSVRAGGTIRKDKLHTLMGGISSPCSLR